MISAVRTSDYSKTKRVTTRRGTRSQTDPLYVRSKTVADQLFERIERLVDMLAPERPTDTEPLNEFDQFNILQLAAVIHSPGYWDDPEALTDLYRLKKQFTGRDDQQLVEFAKAAKARKEALPPPEMTPQNPKWREMMDKMEGRHDDAADS